MSVSFRSGAPADAAAVDGIFRSSFCDTFAHLYRPQDLQAFLAGFTLEAWARELADPRYAFQLAEEAGEAVGYVKLGPLTLPVESAAGMELKQLYLLKAHHGKGVARKLFDWAVDEARQRQASDLFLTLYTQNERARDLYERYGFEPVGRYDFMVGSHADEDIIMRKRL